MLIRFSLPHTWFHTRMRFRK